MSVVNQQWITVTSIIEEAYSRSGRFGGGYWTSYITLAQRKNLQSSREEENLVFRNMTLNPTPFEALKSFGDFSTDTFYVGAIAGGPEDRIPAIITKIKPEEYLGGVLLGQGKKRRRGLFAAVKGDNEMMIRVPHD